MPPITSDELGLAVDLNGCPNRCRHCYLGAPSSGRLAEEDLRGIVGRFRKFVLSDENCTPIRRLAVASWNWEPDYSDRYRELHELEKELSDSGPYRYELLSVWRLARDAEYAEWAKEVGPDTGQITFFGLEETTDWFYRRNGAFRDALKATERLLKVGLKPRWQLFLTKKLIPELPDFLTMVRDLRLRERVTELGSDFVLFMHTPGPDGEGRRIEDLRPTVEEVGSLPAEILESSRKHCAKRDRLWYPECELVSQVHGQEETFPYAYGPPERLWMVVKSNWDVFSNFATLEDWWRLGNLRRDSVASILERFENDEPLGFRTIYTHSPQELAERYGDPAGTKIYSNRDDLLGLYVGRHCGEVSP